MYSEENQLHSKHLHNYVHKRQFVSIPHVLLIHEQILGIHFCSTLTYFIFEWFIDIALAVCGRFQVKM